MRKLMALALMLALAVMLVACGGGGGGGDEAGPGEFKYTSLRDLVGRTPPGTRISIEGTGLSTVVGADRKYEIRNVPNGTYRCTAVAPNGRRDGITLTWKPGEYTKNDWYPRL